MTLKKHILWILAFIPDFFILLSSSNNPWLFGRYSLLHVLVFTGYTTGVVYFILLYFKFGRKALFFILAIALSILFFMGMVELAVQIYAWAKPGYKAYAYQPDEFIGWRPIPDIEYRFTGYKAPWYQKEFLTMVTYDQYGFRNQNVHVEKKPQCCRIGLYGDSFIEAREVSFEQTSASRLENLLNSNSNNLHYEVLNFGISGHSVGQNYLSWQRYGSQFGLDYVCLLVSDFTLNRTPNPFNTDSLRIRPTFSLSGDSLLCKKAEDYEKSVSRYQSSETRIHSELKGKRDEKIRHKFFIMEFFTRLKSQIGTLQNQNLTPTKHVPTHDVLPETLDINLAVIRDFGIELRKHKTQLIVLDACTFFNPDLETTSKQIRDFCLQQDVHYIDLSKKLLEAEAKGISTHWYDDGHFNETGNQILAETVAEWLQRNKVPSD